MAFNTVTRGVLLKHVDSCTISWHLPQIHALIVRTTPSSKPSPFEWNCLMRSYLRHGFSIISLRLYIEMARSGLRPDSYTLPIALKAICKLYLLQLGKQLHSISIKIGLDSNEYCESGIINFYSKIGELANARKVFDGNSQRKLGSWNAMISGFAQVGKSKEAIVLFMDLRASGLTHDDVTLVSVLSACGSLGHLNLVQQMHSFILQSDHNRDKNDRLLLMNSLLDAYSKCGRTDMAHQVFSTMADRNVSSWTAMIMGLAMYGEVDSALQFFHIMRQSIKPNHITFVSILSACAHSGLVKEAMDCFDMMVKDYRIEPTLAHYGCMVDLLGRAGRFSEAKAMIGSMPMEANNVILGSLLGASEKHGNVDVGIWVGRKLIELEPWNDGVYVVMSNIYANAGLWDEAEKIRECMKDLKVSKDLAYSFPTRK